MKLFIVIPAYNEEKNITKVLDSLNKHGYSNIVVIDDCSKDNTKLKALEAGAAVIAHPINLGQGASLKTGIDYALENGADAIVTFDADGQHDVRDIDKVSKPVLEGKYDVILGSRFKGKNNRIPFFRKLILKVAIIIQWIFNGLWLTDAHNGLRCLSRKAAKIINIHSNRMEHASEIIDEVRVNRLKYKEVPVRIIYTDETLKKGHGGFFQAIKVFTKMILRKLV
jgi:glycosyltransferase involved in cell wall biosynthesis